MSSQALRYTPVWEAVDAALQERLIAYWADNGIGIRPQFLQRRAQQVALIILDEEDNIVGLSSVVPKWVPRLNGQFYLYRASLARSVRLSAALGELTDKTFQYFNHQFRAGNRQMPIGFYVNFENPYLNRTRAAVIDDSGLVFIGYNDKGEQERVRYFDGAKIQLKKPLSGQS